MSYCLCGATDCPRCHPATWGTCPECDGEGEDCEYCEEIDDDGSQAYDDHCEAMEEAHEDWLDANDF